MRPSVQILIGDVREQLRTLPEQSVHCVVTSPPYYALRDYGVVGQIGLESTPEEYIAVMVDVFREVRRVLREDGTCWLNIGDSYNNFRVEMGPGQAVHGRDKLNGKPAQKSRRRGWDGLKEKDMMGIPWMLATALRAPYYTGEIKDERDRIWLAAMLDAEGCMFIHRRKAGTANGQGYVRQNDTFSPGIEISNTSEAVVNRIMEIVGKGSICSQSPDQNNRRRQTIYRWNLRTIEARELARELYPHLVAKQHQARLLYGCPPSGEAATEAHAALIALHRGTATNVDFDDPPSMFEPGWYLRSEVIWKKPNPMPESVTDRPTKAHEQIFLLTKSARYFFDQEAVRESGTTDAHARGGREESNTAASVGPMARGRDGFNHQFQNDGRLRGQSNTRNLRTVWTIATEPYSEAHFATFPKAIPERCIKAGTSELGCCATCGAPWERVVEKERRPTRPGEKTKVMGGTPHLAHVAGNGREEVFSESKLPSEIVGNRDPQRHVTESVTTGWEASCDCGGDPVPCTVLDTFSGSCTTGVVAKALGRNFIGCELNPEYAEMGKRRIARGYDPPPKKEVLAGQKQMFD